MNQWMDRPESIGSGMFTEDLIIKKCYSASSKKTISNVLTRKIVALCVWLGIQKHFLYCNFVFSANMFWQERPCYTNAFQGGRTGHSFLENYLFETTIKCTSTFAIFSKSHCVKSLRIRSYLVRIFPHLDWIRRNTPPNAGKYGPE